MASPVVNGKKRKATEDLPVNINIGEASSSAGPAWVNFTAIKPSKKTQFKLFGLNSEQNSSAEFGKQHTIIAAETGDMEFYSVNKDSDDAEDYNCQYLPALFDPSTNSLLVQPSAPAYILAQRVKRLKTSNNTTNLSNPSEMRALQRDQLGEAFGTRKAKNRIKAAERNKVDASAQEGVKGHLLESIQTASASMPTEEELARSALNSRLLPIPNLTTTDPAQVYPLDTLIPEEEFKAIETKAITKAGSDRDRMALLPFGRSRWIESKMRLAIQMPFGAKTNTIKALYYISCMRYFSGKGKLLGKPEELVEKSNGMPKVIIDGLIKRFTETAKGGSAPQITATMETKLLAHQFALMLACENYSCDVEPISIDLKKPAGKVKEIFKSLGCTIDRLTTADKERMGGSAEDQKTSKAVLQAPPVFPKEKKKRGPAGR